MLNGKSRRRSGGELGASTARTNAKTLIPHAVSTDEGSKAQKENHMPFTSFISAIGLGYFLATTILLLRG
jgi:hypothetical protein